VPVEDTEVVATGVVTVKVSVPVLVAAEKFAGVVGVKTADRLLLPLVVSAEVTQVATPEAAVTALHRVALVVTSLKVTVPAATAEGVTVAVSVKLAPEAAEAIVPPPLVSAAVSVLDSVAVVTA
jgi:hypothetical protein